MIYRTDFKINSLNVRLISPVIFGNIVKTYFDIMDQNEVLLQLQKLLNSNTLISDMLLLNQLPVNSFNAETFHDQSDVIREKRKHYREWKKNSRFHCSLGEIENIRPRTQINRKTGTVDEGYLFNETNYIYDRNKTYCFYVYTKDKKVVDLMETALKVIELTGMGTDISIGTGKIDFIKTETGRIFKEDKQMLALFDNGNEGYQLNLASTIFFKQVMDDVKFIKYKTLRYDGKSLKIVKPPYFYADRGCIIKCKSARPYISEYIQDNQKIFIYTCVFPLKINRPEGKSDGYNPLNQQI
jgi:CRISPR/Cas system CSM-associated protein Csm4 (group 5 of RAMP superfamily)